MDPVLRSPKKVIKAIYDYEPQGPGELKFSKGDFFHVVNDDSADADGDFAHGWWEACNPMTSARGMVPVLYFEVFGRSRPPTNKSTSQHNVNYRNSGNSSGGGPVASGGNANAHSSGHHPNGQPHAQTLYAVTLYEFKAEREDELDVAPGENLIICAHHDYEWFIAKPINRLGGPGLVPVSYVKIIDLQSAGAPPPNADIHQKIDAFHIPTVEQWKDRTARYQASTIPLGSITNSTPPSGLLTSQFFEGDGGSNRSSLASTKTAVVEAGVESYQLDRGRYQYLIVARLSNGKTRHLYRYYQDFYDLQVKLLELFPYEAGKIENLRRIIPLIPGPLINVNDSISKLRREKLDYYLRNLVALPAHISRSAEVLRLFEVLENGFDCELGEGDARRLPKPISQQSNYQQDRLSQYLGHHAPAAHRMSSTDSVARSRLLSTSNSHTITAPTKVKVKFYYDDDIFVLLLPTNLHLDDLKSKLRDRLGLGDGAMQLFLKNDYDDFVAENDIVAPGPAHRVRMQEFEVDDDDKFHEVLFDKCKLVIVTEMG